MTTVERESRSFWYVGDDCRVQCVIGYICEDNPGVWWCPAVGYSATEGKHLFDGLVAAAEKAHELATEQSAKAQKTVGFAYRQLVAAYEHERRPHG